MAFSRSRWLRDMVVGVIVGAGTGAVAGSLILPGAGTATGAIAGAAKGTIVGLTGGVMKYPLEWLWDKG